MKLFSLKREWILWIIVLLPVILYLILRTSLPARIPSHYNAAGKADAWMSPAAFLLTLVPVNLLLYVVFLVLPRLDPRRNNYFLFTPTYYYLRLAVHLFLSAIFCFILVSAAGWKLNVIRLTGLCVMLLFVVLGLCIRHVRPTWFIGIRTPWTLKNVTVWRKTHEAGGRWMLILGILGAILVLVLPVQAGKNVILPVILLGVLGPALYSFVLYKKIQHEQGSGNASPH